MTIDHLDDLLRAVPEVESRAFLLDPAGGDVADPVGCDHETYRRTCPDDRGHARNTPGRNRRLSFGSAAGSGVLEKMRGSGCWRDVRRNSELPDGLVTSGVRSEWHRPMHVGGRSCQFR